MDESELEEILISPDQILVIVPDEEIVSPEEPTEIVEQELPIPVIEYLEIQQPVVPSEDILDDVMKGELPGFPDFPE